MFQEWMKIYNKIVYGKEDNMSKSDKIFKEIGYKKVEDNETCVEYNKYYGEEVWEIIFWKETKNDKTNWSGTQTLITPKGRETFKLLYIQ